MERGQTYAAPQDGDDGPEDEGSTAIRQKFMPITMGLSMIGVSIGLLRKGVGALALPFPRPVGSERGSTPHNFGIINTVLGGFMLFVGANFLATAFFRRKQIKRAIPDDPRPPGEPMYVLMFITSLSGFTLLIFSTMCLRNNLSWLGEDQCEEVDAAVLMLVGLGTFVSALIPLGYINVERKHPGAIKKHRLSFYPGFFLFFCPGVVACSMGVMCHEDVLM
jgi:uncharacterized membrane protein YidH (DUF202 family)